MTWLWPINGVSAAVLAVFMAKRGTWTLFGLSVLACGLATYETIVWLRRVALKRRGIKVEGK